MLRWMSAEKTYAVQKSAQVFVVRRIHAPIVTLGSG